jgi:hypothetical protein
MSCDAGFDNNSHTFLLQGGNFGLFIFQVTASPD